MKANNHLNTINATRLWLFICWDGSQRKWNINTPRATIKVISYLILAVLSFLGGQVDTLYFIRVGRWAETLIDMPLLDISLLNVMHLPRRYISHMSVLCMQQLGFCVLWRKTIIGCHISCMWTWHEYCLCYRAKSLQRSFFWVNTTGEKWWTVYCTHSFCTGGATSVFAMAFCLWSCCRFVTDLL